MAGQCICYWSTLLVYIAVPLDSGRMQKEIFLYCTMDRLTLMAICTWVEWNYFIRFANMNDP
jgi:hypothetical protein